MELDNNLKTLLEFKLHINSPENTLQMNPIMRRYFHLITIIPKYKGKRKAIILPGILKRVLSKIKKNNK